MKRPNDGWKIKRDSLYKLVVWFVDGNIRTFYSIDWLNQYARARDEKVGLNRLMKLVHKWDENVKVGELYDRRTGDRVAKFYKGIRQK